MSLTRPDYNSRDDRILYDELFYHDNSDKVLTQQEKDFITSMYHQEEFMCGLDGDIEDYYPNREED